MQSSRLRQLCNFFIPLFKELSKPPPNSDSEAEENSKYDFQDIYGLSSYGAAHANYYNNKFSYGKGGGVIGLVPKNTPTTSNTIIFNIDSEKNTVESSEEIRDIDLDDNKDKDGEVLERL